MNRANTFVRMNAGANPSFSSQAQMLLRASLIAATLVGARILALSDHSNTTILAMWSILVGLIAFISPMFGIALSVGNVFVSIDDVLPVGFSVGHIAGAGASLRLFVQLAAHQIKLQNLLRPSHLVFAGIAFTLLVSALLSYVNVSPIAPLRKLMLIFLLYMLTFIYIDTFDKLLYFQYTLVIVSGLSAAWVIQESLSVSLSSALAEGHGAEGLVGNANYQAIYLAVALPLAIGVALYLEPGIWRVLAICSGALVVMGTISTASRGGLLVLGIGLILSVMVWGPRRKGIQILIGAISFTVIAGFTYNDYTQLRVENTIDALNEGTIGAESRVQLIDDSIAVWNRYPIIGVGPGAWYWGVSQLDTRASVAGSAHVWPMQVLAELGMIGFTCYLVFTLLCVVDYQVAIRKLNQRSSSYSNLLRGFLVSAVAMSLAWSSGNPYNQLWFELLLIGGIGLHIIAQQEEPIPSKFPRSIRR